jgi:hypothetical protein
MLRLYNRNGWRVYWGYVIPDARPKRFIARYPQRLYIGNRLLFWTNKTRNNRG